ncbi:hypothetical protein FGO68_gene2803 [Halteria grandinella]|uniref:Uncharacterized protein n=1 Tax=Halteria grandinella TaxID=5974 RepID=A0A8J8NL09_HALGN|nr:hypothetical protein FGO68_gene2803 [Halteria grandinella]
MIEPDGWATAEKQIIQEEPLSMPPENDSGSPDFNMEARAFLHAINNSGGQLSEIVEESQQQYSQDQRLSRAVQIEEAGELQIDLSEEELVQAQQQ